MNRTKLWLSGALVGVIAVLASVLGMLAFLLALLLAIPLIRRSEGRVALSGLLTGFGVLWLVLIEREFASGGVLDNAGPWIGVGVVSVAIGLGLLATIRRPGWRPGRP
jgi:hypothetical protein